jgi:activator of HSP90 ATPase
MTFEFTVSDVIPASAEEIYDAWMDAAKHAAMTGGREAKIDPRIGGEFAVWQGYLTGKTLALEPGKRIVQSWRSTKFAPADPDSQVEITFEAAPRGTRVRVRHSNVPDGHTSYRDGGWQDNYFEPMKKYFGTK